MDQQISNDAKAVVVGYQLIRVGVLLRLLEHQDYGSAKLAEIVPKVVSERYLVSIGRGKSEVMTLVQHRTFSKPGERDTMVRNLVCASVGIYWRSLSGSDRLEELVSYLFSNWFNLDSIVRLSTDVTETSSSWNDIVSNPDLEILRLHPGEVDESLLAILTSDQRISLQTQERYHLGSPNPRFFVARMAYLGGELTNLYRIEQATAVTLPSIHDYEQEKKLLFPNSASEAQLSSLRLITTYPKRLVSALVAIVYLLSEDLDRCYDYVSRWIFPQVARSVDERGRTALLTSSQIERIQRLTYQEFERLHQQPANYQTLSAFYRDRLSYTLTLSTYHTDQGITVVGRWLNPTSLRSHRLVASGATVNEAKDAWARSALNHTYQSAQELVPDDLPEVTIEPLRLDFHLDGSPWDTIPDQDLSSLLDHGTPEFEQLEFEGDRVMYQLVPYLLGSQTRHQIQLVRNSTFYCLLNQRNLCCRLRKPGRITVKDCADLFEALIGLMAFHVGTDDYGLQLLADYISRWWITPPMIERIIAGDRIDDCLVGDQDVQNVKLSTPLPQC